MGPQCNKGARERSEKAISSHLWLMQSCVMKEREKEGDSTREGERETEKERERTSPGQRRWGREREKKAKAATQATLLSAWLSAGMELLSKNWERHGFQAF